MGFPALHIVLSMYRTFGKVQETVLCSDGRKETPNTSRHRKAGKCWCRVATPMGQTSQMLLRAGTGKKNHLRQVGE